MPLGAFKSGKSFGRKGTKGNSPQFYYFENIVPPLALPRQTPRYRRIVVADCAHHVTQRGNQRAVVFGPDQDRSVYLNLIKRNSRDCGVSVLGYSLMPNHVHWIVTPHAEEALAEALGRTHYRYSHYFQAQRATRGHLWPNRFYSCPLGCDHLVVAMRYVEQNPVRAGFVESAEAYAWSSAQAHVTGWDEWDMLDMAAWGAICDRQRWWQILSAAAERHEYEMLERATYGGKPCGGAGYRSELSARVVRDLDLRGSGRPGKAEHARSKSADC